MQPSRMPKPLTKATPTSPVPMIRSIMQILSMPFAGSARTKPSTTFSVSTEPGVSREPSRVLMQRTFTESPASAGAATRKSSGASTRSMFIVP